MLFWGILRSHHRNSLYDDIAPLGFLFLSNAFYIFFGLVYHVTIEHLLDFCRMVIRQYTCNNQEQKMF